MDITKMVKTVTTAPPPAKEDIYRNNQLLLRSLTGMSEWDLFWYVWEQGMKYIAVQCRGHHPDIEILKHEAFFWRWWLEQWHQRDDEFIAYHQLGLLEQSNARPAKNVAAAYTYYHEKAMNHETLCKSYMHLLTSTTKIWRPKL